MPSFVTFALCKAPAVGPEDENTQIRGAILLLLHVAKETSAVIRFWIETTFDKERLARGIDDASPLRLCECAHCKVPLTRIAVHIRPEFD